MRPLWIGHHPGAAVLRAVVLVRCVGPAPVTAADGGGAGSGRFVARLHELGQLGVVSSSTDFPVSASGRCGGSVLVDVRPAALDVGSPRRLRRNVRAAVTRRAAGFAACCASGVVRRRRRSRSQQDRRQALPHKSLPKMSVLHDAFDEVDQLAGHARIRRADREQLRRMVVPRLCHSEARAVLVDQLFILQRPAATVSRVVPLRGSEEHGMSPRVMWPGITMSGQRVQSSPK